MKLDVKPMLTITLDGKLGLCGMVRGRKKGIKQLLGYFVKRIPEGERDRTIFVGHADCPEGAERLVDMLKKGCAPGADIVITNVGPVIGSHVGPGKWSPSCPSVPTVRTTRHCWAVSERRGHDVSW